MDTVEVLESVKCFHCGNACDDPVYADEKAFCCSGCKTVYEILSSNNLCNYYKLDEHSGVSQKKVTPGSFDYLDMPELRQKLLSFDSPELSKVEFVIPSIHCVSCIWLLENLRKVNSGILKAEVSFGRKSIIIDFDPSRIKPSEVATLLATLGYAPVTSMDNMSGKDQTKRNPLVYRLAIAGFCFGNIMLFSFPEYLGLDSHDESLRLMFSWLNLILAIPVFFYSASGYLLSAYQSFKQKQINIDVSITAGLVALFLRSGYDIVMQTGPGYLDSFSGLVFFLLIGQWFQGRTYETLAFDRDFKSYFPLAVHVLQNNEWKPKVIHDLRKGDIIRMRNMDIVPADGILHDEQAHFDYSFITGEAQPVKLTKGDLVYAGARLSGAPVTLTVDKTSSASHLTSLWNREEFRKSSEKNYQKIIDRAARKFTWIVLILALLTAVVWYFKAPSEMWTVLTSVLMVACPCALALAAPFTYGSMLRVFGQNQFYLKNADIIERIAAIDTVVFDKTGTITHGHQPGIQFHGDLDDSELASIKLLTGSSGHPLSKLISEFINLPQAGEITSFREHTGKGMEAVIAGKNFKAGSAEFLAIHMEQMKDRSYVFISINDRPKGYFTVTIKTRSYLKEMIERLGAYRIALLSGDNNSAQASMKDLFPREAELKFNQRPLDKMNYIRELQTTGKKVMMVGDGLNDSGALQQSDVGIAISDDTAIFTPACDGILQGDRLRDLDKFIALAKSSSGILKLSFGISFFYNAIALTVAMTGHLTPLVAAILMPISSISVVSFSSAAVKFVAKRKLSSKKR